MNKATLDKIARTVPPPIAAIRAIVDYCYAEEEADYRRAVEAGDIEEYDSRHVFMQLERVELWLRGRGSMPS